MTPKNPESPTLVIRSFRISEATWGKFEALAKRKRRKPTEFVRILIEDQLAGRAAAA